MTLYAGQRFDVAEALLGRDDEDRIVVEAVRPKSDLWRLELEHDLARSVMGQVANHHFHDGTDAEQDVLLVAHQYAERLTEVLAQNDVAGLIALVAESIQKKETNHHV